METTTVRRPIDVAPDRSKAPLAFGLALASVPGSTFAWDLPAGGLWIGLPLALAAIVLGMRARGSTLAGSGRGLATAAIVIAGLMILQMVVWTIASIAS